MIMRTRGTLVWIRAVALTASFTAALHGWSGESRIADAAMSGDRTAVRSLIAKGEDVNAAQGDGMTALHWAARRGDVDLVKLLLTAGANARATTRLGSYTPLLMASEMGHAAAIEALLAGGADLQVKTASGVTPLMLSAASGQADAVRALIAHGADVNAAESVRGETALMFAIANRRLDAAKVLIASRADVNAASKVVSLKTAPLSPEEEAYLAAQAGRGGRQSGRQQGDEGGQGAAPPQGSGQRGGGGRRGGAPGGIAGVTRQYTFAELVGAQGGLTPLHFAARQGDLDAVRTLVDAGSKVNAVTGSDHTTPLLIAIINGQFDLAAWLLDHGGDPCIPADNGVTPLYATLNVQWAPKTLYPQPRAYLQQKLTYLEFMKRLLDKGVDVDARLRRKVWYSEYNFPLLGVDEVGATPFWRAAYASDVEAMKLLVAYGADPNIPTIKPAGRPRTGDAAGRETIDDVSGVPPVPVGGPGVPPLHAAAGVGYGEGFAANSHRNAPTGFLPAVQYLVEELHADVNSRDHEGNTALHHAAARGDNAMIEYLVSKGADVRAVNRAGETTADMANSPVSRIEPFPATIALLEKLGSKNNHHCHSCS
jgi:uncharacterized protein